MKIRWNFDSSGAIQKLVARGQRSICWFPIPNTSSPNIYIHIISKIFTYISSILYITELVAVDHLWLKIVLIFRILPIQPPIQLLERSPIVSAHVKMVMFYKTFSSHLILKKGPYFYHIKLRVSFNGMTTLWILAQKWWRHYRSLEKIHFAL